MTSHNIHMKLRPWSMWPYMCVLPTRTFIKSNVNETSDTTFPLFGIAMATPCSLHSITIMLPRSYRWKKMSKAMNISLHGLLFVWECEPVIYAESNDLLTSPTVSKDNFIGVEKCKCCFMLITILDNIIYLLVYWYIFYLIGQSSNDCWAPQLLKNFTYYA